MQSRVEVIVEELKFPEGPAFSADGSLWAVELKGENLVRYQNDKLERFNVGGRPNGIAIDKLGMIWFCDSGNNTIRRFDPVQLTTETMASHVDGDALDEPNDLTFDAHGNLLFTCPGNSRKEATGYICVLKTDGMVKKIIQGKYFPNGLAFTNDGKDLVFAETYRHQLWKGSWDALNCEWTEGLVWCKVGGPDGPGGPDGMAFDPQGNLYVAVYGTGEIRVVNSDGVVINKIGLPGLNPTNCAFDPKGRYHLVVTEAEKGVLLNITKNKEINK